MAVVDGSSYLVGKIIEVNYTNSRALLFSDLNSKIPVMLLEPDWNSSCSFWNWKKSWHY